MVVRFQYIVYVCVCVCVCGWGGSLSVCMNNCKEGGNYVKGVARVEGGGSGMPLCRGDKCVGYGTRYQEMLLKVISFCRILH